ncbi:hypothetical protein LIER_01732 [Lithospermum erythrorhizon]|uniref:BHLH domain-containing protein n=1 Tax=Lithospermum erythrorhizon TaxID=34254 RepID=A0AAV3NMP2_LITER
MLFSNNKSFINPSTINQNGSNGAQNGSQSDVHSLRKRNEEVDNWNGTGVCISSNGNDVNENDCKRMKTMGANENQEGEGNSGKEAEETAKPPEPPKQDYIHVQARRGQATDSHSLAERKISERIKTLQDLVPGCNKVIGKALVLDEIINYVQSLQNQVEFLSMKLEAVNSRVTPNIEGFPVKDFGQQQAFDTSGGGFEEQREQ